MNSGVSLLCPLTLDCIFSGVSRFPKNGEEVYADSLQMTLGGGSCVAAMRLFTAGIPVSMGTFWNGGLRSEIALRLSETLGFRCALHNLYDGDKDPVLFSSVFTDERERNIVTYDTGISEASFSAKVIYDFLKGAKLSVAPQCPEAVKALHEDGTKLLYDVHWAEGQTLKTHAEILKYADVFTPNAKEAMALTETVTPEAALHALCDYTAFPIVKLGKQGCIAKIDGKMRSFLPPVAHTVDTTGAGDNFLAGLLFGLYQDANIEDCIRIANAAGAASTESFGCFGASYDLWQFL